MYLDVRTMEETAKQILGSDGKVYSTDKSFPISQAAQTWLAGGDVDGDMPDRPTKPMAQNEWVYACINAIITAARGVQMTLATGDDTLVESGEAYDLLFNNPEMPFENFITETIGHFAMSREVYWVFPDLNVQRPTSILVVGKDQLKPCIRSGILLGWDLHKPNGDKVPYMLNEVWPIADFNPYSTIHGLGPDVAGKLAISSSYQASLLNESTMANGGKVGNVITTGPGVRLDETQIRMLRSQFEARHKGARNAGRTCVLTGGTDIKSIAQSMADLQMLDLRSFDGKVISMLYSVPTEVLGMASEAQYAHGPAQQRFIVNTIAPLLAFIGGHVTRGILSRFPSDTKHAVTVNKSVNFMGRTTSLRRRSSYRQSRMKALQSGSKLFAWFAVEEHPTIQEMVQDKTERVLKHTERGVPLNQIIEVHDLPYDPVAWGDDHWINMNLIPAKWIIDAGPEGFAEPSLPEGDTDEDNEDEGKSLTEKFAEIVEQDLQEKADDDRKARIWKRWTKSWRGIEREYAEAMRRYFMRQERILTKKLKQAYSEFADKDAVSIKAAADEVIARVVFDLKLENGKIKVINKIHYDKASELGIRQMFDETLSLEDEQLQAAVDAAMADRKLKAKRTTSSYKISKANKTTQKLVSKQLREGLDKGESLDELTKRIEGILKGKKGRARAQRIARTQTAGAVSSGRQTGMVHANVDRKSWLSARDNTVRPAHKAAEAKYSKGIAVDQVFVVDGENLMYPGDPSGSAANIANCRCMTIALAAAGKSFGLSYYDRKQFVTYEDMDRAS